MGKTTGETAEQTGAARLSAGWIAAIVLVVLAGLAMRMYGFSLFDIGYSDEVMQYLEQANRMATGTGLIPWENRVGLRSALIPQLLFGPIALGHWLAPGTLLHVGLARAFFLALTLIVLPSAWKLGALHSRAAALVALTVVALWWESVLFSEFMLAESLGAGPMLLGAALLLSPKADRRTLFFAGLLLGFAVLIRLQHAAFAAATVILALRLEWKRWMPILAGGLLAALIGCVSDLAAGQMPFRWIWVTYYQNLGNGLQQQFGTLPPSAYLMMLYEHLAPLAPAVLVLALFVPARLRPLLVAALVNLLAFSLIGHKEYRYVWMTPLTLLVLAAIGSTRLAERFLGDARGQLRPVAVALLCIGWALCSLWSARVSGGAGAFRGGGAMAALIDAAPDQGAICGIAFPYEYKSHLVSSMMAHPKPLALLPEGWIDGHDALPAGIAASSNLLFLNKDARAPDGYQKTACHAGPDGFPCLYRRAGTCTPAPYYSYQQTLIRHRL